MRNSLFLSAYDASKYLTEKAAKQFPYTPTVCQVAFMHGLDFLARHDHMQACMFAGANYFAPGSLTPFNDLSYFLKMYYEAL